MVNKKVVVITIIANSFWVLTENSVPTIIPTYYFIHFRDKKMEYLPNIIWLVNDLSPGPLLSLNPIHLPSSSRLPELAVAQQCLPSLTIHMEKAPWTRPPLLLKWQGLVSKIRKWQSEK
jgi:hypothetical protein